MGTLMTPKEYAEKIDGWGEYPHLASMIEERDQATADVLCALLDEEPTINQMVLKERVVNLIRATLSNK